MLAGAGWDTAADVIQLHFCAPPRWGSRDDCLLKGRPLSCEQVIGTLFPARRPGNRSSTLHYGPCCAPGTVASAAAAPGGFRSRSRFSIRPRYWSRIYSSYPFSPGTCFLARAVPRASCQGEILHSYCRNFWALTPDLPVLGRHQIWPSLLLFFFWLQGIT